MAVTDAAGGDVFDDVPVGVGYTLTVTAPEATTASWPRTVTVPADSEAPVVDQDFTITPDPRGTASGTVGAEGDGPVSGVRVTVTATDGTGRGTTTDGDGRWSLPDLPPERYTVIVVAPDGATVVGDGTLDATVPARGGTVGGLDFVLRFPAPPATFSADGLVTDEGDMAFPDVPVTVRDPDGQALDEVTTGEDGRRRVDGLLPGERWTATVDPPQGFGAQDDDTLTLAVADEDTTGLDFALVEDAGTGSGSGSGGSTSTGSGTTLAATGGPELALLVGGAAALAAGLVLVRPGRARRR